MSEQRPLSNRQTQFSDAFRSFITSHWAPYDPQLPAPTAGAHAAAQHREKLSKHFPGERIVLPAGGLKVRNNDCDYRFRPHTAFTWATGLGTDREPDAVLVMEPTGDHHEAMLFFHPRVPRTDEEFYADSRYGEMWVGQRESLEEMTALCGVRTAPIQALSQAIDTKIPTRVVRDPDPDLATKIDVWRGGTTEQADAELAQVVSELRLIKDDFEIAQMRQACEATAAGFRAVVAQLPNAVAKGRGERWVEGIFGLHARHRGNAVGYDTIAAAGDHANTLHWIRNDGDLRNGDLLLLDAGVELDSLFTADVTRTLPINGRFTPAQRTIYQAVLEAQRAGMDAARPGAKFSDVHQAAIKVIARKLEEWGLLPVSAEESLSPAGGQHRRWMVHGTSHHLGLDVHDCAQARREVYREGELAPGMIITVEPGLYFKATDLLVPEEFRGIGVRIEDDILITEDSCEILSSQLPREPDAIEAWMNELMTS